MSRGRGRKRRRIGHAPNYRHFYPASGKGLHLGDPVFLSLEELEAFRLVDFVGLTQAQAGERMGISRGTLWRILTRARKKVADSIINGREIVIMPREEHESLERE